MTFHYPHLARCSRKSQISEGQVPPPTHPPTHNTHFLTKACPFPDVKSQDPDKQKNNYPVDKFVSASIQGSKML